MALVSARPRASHPAGIVAGASFVLVLLAGCAAPLVSGARSATREPLQLSASEREHLRSGMRTFLESVEGITRGIAENRMPAVARSAKQSGWDMMDAAATATALKLPPEFVAVSIDTHQKFDDLAAAAAANTPKAKLLEDLGHILSNCTSCHAKYRLSFD